MLAILCAHEIGHALGINLHSTDTSNMGIMFPANFTKIGHVYSDFNYFIGWEFDSNSADNYPFLLGSGLNVRDILSVHNIDIGN